MRRHTVRPIEQTQTDTDRDQWFTPNEAVKYGLISRVINSYAELDA